MCVCGMQQIGEEKAAQQQTGEEAESKAAKQVGSARKEGESRAASLTESIRMGVESRAVDQAKEGYQCGTWKKVQG